MLEKEFDVVILGGGPAGFSAGIYTARGNVSTAILDVSMLGGYRGAIFSVSAN